MERTRILGGALLAATLLVPLRVAGAAADGETSAPLPPGARPVSERAFVELRDAAYGKRWVEPVAASAPEQQTPVSEVEYTVDPALEAAVREVLARDGVGLAHVIAMDPATGEVFAYVSTDPERFPATQRMPTASLMKLVTAAALLQRAPAVTERPCRTVGSPYELREAHLTPPKGDAAALPAVSAAAANSGAGGGGHDAVPPGTASAVWENSFQRALAISNNQCFARYAVHDVGEEHLVAEMRRVGLLASPGPGHATGVVDPIAAPLDLGNLGSGLAGSAITPLAAVRLAALLAEGRLVTPWWMAQRFDPEDAALVTFEPTSTAARVWEPELADTLRGLLRSVTEDGTARRAFKREDGTPRLGAVGVAGKTGTLRGEGPDGLYQWFAGVAPDDAPTLAIATVVVHPDDAERGASASQVAAGVLERVFCDTEGGCDATRADGLRERSAARARWVADFRDEAAAAEAAALAARDEREGSLDAPLRLLASTRVELPERLRRRRWDGEVRMRIEVGPDGGVVAAAVEASDLPDPFGEFLVAEVHGWRFNPPRRGGRPVSATVVLPIPIRVD